MTNQTPALPPAFSGPPTTSMTSQEIADLVESRHDKVKQSIERLVERGVIPQPPMGVGIKAPNGVITQEYNLDKRSSIIVVAQLSPEFTARIVDRWQELETKLAQLSADTDLLLRLPPMETQAVWEAGLRVAQTQMNGLMNAKAKRAMLEAVENATGLNATPAQVVAASLEFYNKNAAKFLKMAQPDAKESVRQLRLGH